MMAERMYRKGGEWKKKQEPAFQKYIFAAIEDVDDFRIRLRKVGETAKILGVGDEIVPIDPQEEALLETLGGPEHVISMSKGYLEGEKLVVTEGPLQGMEGTVRWLNARQKVVGVAVSLLGREVVVRLGVEAVKRVADGMA